MQLSQQGPGSCLQGHPGIMQKACLPFHAPRAPVGGVQLKEPFRGVLEWVKLGQQREAVRCGEHIHVVAVHSGPVPRSRQLLCQPKDQGQLVILQGATVWELMEEKPQVQPTACSIRTGNPCM